MASPRKHARNAANGKNVEVNAAEQEIKEAEQQLPLSQKVVERLKVLKFCPITKIVDLARNANSAHVQLEAAKCLLNKIVPDLKAIEIDPGTTENKYQLNIHFHKDADLISSDKHNQFLQQLKPFIPPAQ